MTTTMMMMMMMIITIISIRGLPGLRRDRERQRGLKPPRVAEVGALRDMQSAGETGDFFKLNIFVVSVVIFVVFMFLVCICLLNNNVFCCVGPYSVTACLPRVSLASRCIK